MLRARVHRDEIAIGTHRSVSFQRTLRIPDDDGVYPLPPGLGRFPLRREGVEVLLPMYRREALWISFDGSWWRPSAVKIGVGGINAISGEPLDDQIRPGRQDYVVCPDQPRLDGIKAGDGFIRQFVGVELGKRLTVEGQLTGEESVGGIQIRVFEPKPGLFSDEDPRLLAAARGELGSEAVQVCLHDMGIGAGGRMVQEVYPDDYGWNTWDSTSVGRADLRLCSIVEWQARTGEPAPPTPIDADAYTQAGLPWFAYYSEAGDIPTPDRLSGLRSVQELDDASFDDKGTVSVPPWQVAILKGK